MRDGGQNMTQRLDGTTARNAQPEGRLAHRKPDSNLAGRQSTENLYHECRDALAVSVTEESESKNVEDRKTS